MKSCPKHHFEVASKTRQKYGAQTYGAPADAEKDSGFGEAT
jgi:hypothetical protein